jgi:glycosyltransferase involved in cell wall biosynthesis
MKIVVIYDNKFEYTTGFYCVKALKKLGHEVIYQNYLKDKDKISNVDFYLNVDDDSNYLLPKDWYPNIYWVSDTHRLGFKNIWRFDKCRKVDFLFTSQKDAMLNFKNEGLEKVFWLPHACDEDYHSSVNIEKLFDIGFVGNCNSKIHFKRNYLLNKIKNSFKNNAIVKSLYLNEMADLYSKSRIVFNCSLNNDINMRLFEGMCSGSLVITDNIPFLYEVVNSDSVVSYKNESDLLNKIEKYLNDQEASKIISDNGKKEVLEKHTYVNRMQKIIETLNNIRN